MEFLIGKIVWASAMGLGVSTAGLVLITTAGLPFRRLGTAFAIGAAMSVASISVAISVARNGERAQPSPTELEQSSIGRQPPETKDVNRPIYTSPQIRTAPPAPNQSTIELNPDFFSGGGAEAEKWFQSALLSASGYPLIVTKIAAPVCLFPFQMKEAMEAWRASDIGWLNSMKSCLIMPQGTDAEWVRMNGGGSNTITLRVALPSGSRQTLYAPNTSPAGLGSWFGMYQR